MKAAILAAAITVTLATLANAQAQEVPVDLELVLATDVSASIDEEEAVLQRAGYLAALTNPDVIDAIRGGVLGRIAVTYVEWADAQRTVVGWTVIEDKASARAFAVALRSASLSSGTTTSISGALDYAAGLFDANGFEGTRQVIDISGDGENNDGVGPEYFRAQGKLDGITINGLVVQGAYPDPVPYYRDHVIQGPGAFVALARDYDDYPPVMIGKLLREIDQEMVLGEAQ